MLIYFEFVYYGFDLIFGVLTPLFSNISAISWRPVLVVEEAGENHWPWASNVYYGGLGEKITRVSQTLICLILGQVKFDSVQ